MTTRRDLWQRAQQQKRRRTARRVCGHCGQQAKKMIAWGRQQVPICLACDSRLNGDVPHWRDWSLTGPQQGLRCPLDVSRPCYDCIHGEDPTPTPEQRRMIRQLIRPFLRQ